MAKNTSRAKGKKVAGFEQPKRKPKRAPYPIPEPTANDWPEYWEPVDHHCARDAVAFGNAAILVRYLRETERVDRSVLNLIERMLDPDSTDLPRRLVFRRRRRGRSAEKRPTLPLCAQDLADLLDPQAHSQAWKLEFKKHKGSQGKPNQYWRQHSIFMKTFFARAKCAGKLYLAVEAVAEETGLDRATIYRAWEAHK
jgi:hypothetical protein